MYDLTLYQNIQTLNLLQKHFYDTRLQKISPSFLGHQEILAHQGFQLDPAVRQKSLFNIQCNYSWMARGQQFKFMFCVLFLHRGQDLFLNWIGGSIFPIHMISSSRRLSFYIFNFYLFSPVLHTLQTSSRLGVLNTHHVYLQYTVDTKSYQRAWFANMARCTTFSLTEKDSKHLLILKDHLKCFKSFQIGGQCYFILPQDQSVQFCLFLPACPLAPETEDILNIYLNDLTLIL